MTAADAIYDGLLEFGMAVGYVFHVSITFDGSDCAFVAALPSLRSANTDKPLHALVSLPHPHKWGHNSAVAGDNLATSRRSVGRDPRLSCQRRSGGANAIGDYQREDSLD
jgi:hypothetical protein